MYYNINELHELNKTASPWAFDPAELDGNPSPVVLAGLCCFLASCFETLNHYGESSARDIVENGTAWSCSGLWVMDEHPIISGKYKDHYIKGVKITKNGVPLVEIWNEADDIKVLRG